MVKLYDGGAYLVNGKEIVPEAEAAKVEALTGKKAEKSEARKGTMAYNIMKAHNTSGNMENLKLKFDAMASHDITFVGIIQTAKASGMEKFPIPYVLTNCHNSLCAVGGTINEDDHMFGLSAAKKYGGIYVPPHIAVIHQYMREMFAGCGKMILGSDSHTRYGALGTMAIGEGGPELVKQILSLTYDVKAPEVIAVRLTGKVKPGVGPQDVALALIGAVFKSGFVKNKVLEFVGDGIASLPIEFRNGIDVMTTETTCLSSIWITDEETERYFVRHGRPEAYGKLEPGELAYYDGAVDIDLSTVEPMIALPFHPSNAFTVRELNENAADILRETEKAGEAKLGLRPGALRLTDKVDRETGRLRVSQGVIAGCAGGTYDNLSAAADILRGHSIGCGEFALSAYPASQPVFARMLETGIARDLMLTGATLRSAFCGPCFGAGDTPANNAFSIRHSTRNFPNREGSKIQNGQISSVALMDARSIAATAANKGFLTAADEFTGTYTKPAYHFDKKIYENRVFDSKGVADPSVEIQFGPNIKDWPAMPQLAENLILKVVSEIHDPVTTTDELIPSGETSSFRSNPLGLAEFTLSRKDPAYVGRAKEVQVAEKAIQEGNCPAEALPELKPVFAAIHTQYPDIDKTNVGVGSTIFAVKPGDGSAREQAASCQKVLGGWANIANEYATKRYRSNLINWGMLPFLIPEGDLPFTNGDYIFVPEIRKAVEEKADVIKAYVVKDGALVPFEMTLGALTDDEREIIRKGCLINYYRG